MILGQIFSKSYLLDPMPPRESRFYLPLLIFFSLLIVLSVIIKIVPAKIDKLSKKYFPAFLVPGVIGLIYLFGRFERLPWLGSRLMIVIALAVLFGWILINSVWVIRFVPRHLQERKKEERYQRYLPKPKKLTK